MQARGPAAASESGAAGQSSRGRGRPTTYSAEIAERICEVIAEGRMLRDACRECGVDKKVVYGWADRHEEFDEALFALGSATRSPSKSNSSTRTPDPATTRRAAKMDSS